MNSRESLATECAPQPTDVTQLERVAELTTWGRYLAEVEKKGILRGEALLERPGNAIDTGCGGGRWSKLLSNRGWHVTSTDINPHFLAICQRNVPDAKCILGKPADRSIPVRSESIRLALCMEVPQLIEADWLPPEVYRILSPGGIFVGVHFNVLSWRSAVWRCKRWLTNRAGDGSYTISYSTCRNRFRRAGFAVLHEESYCWGPFSRESNSRLVSAFAKAERLLGLNRLVRLAPWILFIARKVRR